MCLWKRLRATLNHRAHSLLHKSVAAPRWRRRRFLATHFSSKVFVWSVSVITVMKCRLTSSLWRNTLESKVLKRIWKLQNFHSKSFRRNWLIFSTLCVYLVLVKTSPFSFSLSLPLSLSLSPSLSLLSRLLLIAFSPQSIGSRRHLLFAFEAKPDFEKKISAGWNFSSKHFHQIQLKLFFAEKWSKFRSELRRKGI